MYFNEFNTMYYPFSINGQEVVKIVRDITTNVRLRKAILENVTLFDEYDIVDGETPEIISAKVYGSPEFHWVIMLCNQRYDYLNDFPMSERVLNDYIAAKYEGDEYETHHYVDDRGFTVASTTPGATPITNYQYEVDLNESKRRIKLISPQLLTQLITQFKSII